jgi:hypothetical protein
VVGVVSNGSGNNSSSNNVTKCSSNRGNTKVV